MDSLKFYLKDHLIITALFIPIYLFGIVYLFFSLFSVVNGDTDYSRIKFIFIAPFFIPAGIYFYSRLKKMLNVIRDIKEEKLIKEVFYINSSEYTLCERDYLGAYQNVYCTKNQNDTNKMCLWWYKNDLVYPTFDPPGEKYEVTYYKYSKCIVCIKRITFNNKAKHRKIKKDKGTSKKILVDNYHIHFDNNIEGFIIWPLILLIIPILLYFGNKYIPTIGMFKDNYHDAVILYNVIIAPLIVASLYNTGKHILSYICNKKELCVSGIFTTISVPLEKKYLVNGKPIVYYLRFTDENSIKHKLFFYSTDILGLGVLEDRLGYKGYGNFIGTKYEIEYYKVSRVIKSIKLISLPDKNRDCKNQSDYGSR